MYTLYIHTQTCTSDVHIYTPYKHTTAHPQQTYHQQSNVYKLRYSAIENTFYLVLSIYFILMFISIFLLGSVTSLLWQVAGGVLWCV